MSQHEALFDYQKYGAKWLANKKTALLADEQRLGKSVQAIIAADLIGANNIIVVCRGVARANWSEEFKKWSERIFRFFIIYDRTGSLVPFWESPNIPTVVITSYECLESILQKLPKDFKFCLALVDESHYVKSIEAKRTRAVLGKGGLPLFTRRIWCLTGTPCPNNASELWPTLFTFGATKLGFWDFAKRYCRVIDNGFGTQILGTRMEKETLDELRAIMAKKILRRTTKDVSVQLPKMSFSTVMVPPGKVDLGLTTFWKYAIPTDRSKELNKIIKEELGIIEGILKDGKTMSHELLETLKAQAKSISTLRRYTALQKLEPACELITQELESNAYNKCVIFAHHRDCILGAAQRLYKFHPVTMYGGTAPSRLERNLKNFQNPKHKTRVFIGQISAAGTSISLSAANHIFFLEESFVPGDNMQAAMRCGGVNQPNPIFVRTFCLENSFDTRVQDILRQKMVEIAQLYGESSLSHKSEAGLPPDMI